MWERDGETELRMLLLVATGWWGGGLGTLGPVSSFPLFFSSEQSPCVYLKLDRSCGREHWRGVRS